MDRDLRGGGGDVGFADAARDVDGVEEDAVAFDLGLECDACLHGEVHEGIFFVEGVVVLDCLEGESTIHGSGFEVEEAEAAGEMGGESALAGSSRTVNGDDGAEALFGLRLREGLGAFVRLRHRAYSPSLGLNLRAGGRLPKGFLLSLNLSKVPAGLPDLPAADLVKGFLPAKPADFFAKVPVDFPAKGLLDLPNGFFAPKGLPGLRA